MQVDLACEARLACPLGFAQAGEAGGVGAGRASSATAREPAVVGSPAMSMRSFTATRRPEPGGVFLMIQVPMVPSSGRSAHERGNVISAHIASRVRTAVDNARPL